MIYNQQKHIQLLKRSQDFKNQGKSFYKQSTEKSLELSHYNAAVEQHIFWQHPVTLLTGSTRLITNVT
jgi:hypothetical protein